MQILRWHIFADTINMIHLLSDISLLV